MKGLSLRLGLLAIGCCATVVAQERAPLKPPKQPLPEVVLSDAADSVSVADFGLGDGGVARQRTELRWHDEDGCVTSGGVRIVCRSVGVKLTFPSGREVLLGPDGGLHLRSGESAGPFPAGLEFLLADGTAVRVALAQSRRDRVRDVWVVEGDRALQPWRRGKPAEKREKVRHWAGLRIACCGDGGDLYRPLALGPLLVLDRVLVPSGREEDTPAERLVVLTDPLRKSLATMHRQHRDIDAVVRRAVTAVSGVADRSSTIFPAGASLRRAERDRLRWLLGAGFELQLDLEGVMAPRLQLFAGNSLLPMVEWTLGANAAAYLTNPHDDQLGKRWHGNGTRLPRVVPELQARADRSERQQALNVIRRLKR